MCTIVSHVNLNLQEIQMYDELLEFMNLDVDDMVGLMKEQDYKKITISINNNEYTLFHGFPGDESVGCIFIENKYVVNLDDNEITHIINFDGKVDKYIPNDVSAPNDVLVPSKYVDDIKKIKEWYKNITKDRTSFDDDFFYSSRIEKSQ